MAPAFSGGPWPRSWSSVATRSVILSRGETGHVAGTRTVVWDAESIGAWVHELDGADAVVHLNGRRVDVRATRGNIDELISSRVQPVRVVGEAIERCSAPPRAWVQSSSLAVYGDGGDAILDERSTPTGIGPREMVTVCLAWEGAFHQASAAVPRTVLLRLGIGLGGRNDPATVKLAAARSVGPRGPCRVGPSVGVLGRARRPAQRDDPGDRRRLPDGYVPRDLAQPGDQRRDDVDLSAPARTKGRAAQPSVVGTNRRADSRQQRQPGIDRSKGYPGPPNRSRLRPSTNRTSSRRRARLSSLAACCSNGSAAVKWRSAVGRCRRRRRCPCGTACGRGAARPGWTSSPRNRWSARSWCPEETRPSPTSASKTLEDDDPPVRDGDRPIGVLRNDDPVAQKRPIRAGRLGGKDMLHRFSRLEKRCRAVLNTFADC